MFKERFLEWLKAAGIRALKTTAQALAAGILSLLTSIGGLPELKRASD